MKWASSYVCMHQLTKNVIPQKERSSSRTSDYTQIRGGRGRQLRNFARDFIPRGVDSRETSAWTVFRDILLQLPCITCQGLRS